MSFTVCVIYVAWPLLRRGVPPSVASLTLPTHTAHTLRQESQVATMLDTTLPHYVTFFPHAVYYITNTVN